MQCLQDILSSQGLINMYLADSGLSCLGPLLSKQRAARRWDAPVSTATTERQLSGVAGTSAVETNEAPPNSTADADENVDATTGSSPADIRGATLKPPADAEKPGTISISSPTFATVGELRIGLYKYRFPRLPEDGSMEGLHTFWNLDPFQMAGMSAPDRRIGGIVLGLMQECKAYGWPQPHKPRLVNWAVHLSCWSGCTLVEHAEQQPLSRNSFSRTSTADAASDSSAKEPAADTCGLGSARDDACRADDCGSFSSQLGECVALIPEIKGEYIAYLRRMNAGAPGPAGPDTSTEGKPAGSLPASPMHNFMMDTTQPRRGVRSETRPTALTSAAARAPATSAPAPTAISSASSPVAAAEQTADCKSPATPSSTAPRKEGQMPASASVKGSSNQIAATAAGPASHAPMGADMGTSSATGPTDRARPETTAAAGPASHVLQAATPASASLNKPGRQHRSAAAADGQQASVSSDAASAYEMRSAASSTKPKTPAQQRTEAAAEPSRESDPGTGRSAHGAGAATSSTESKSPDGRWSEAAAEAARAAESAAAELILEEAAEKEAKLRKQEAKQRKKAKVPDPQGTSSARSAGDDDVPADNAVIDGVKEAEAKSGG